MEGLLGHMELTGSRALDALIILLATLVLAKIADLIINRALRRLTRLTSTEADDKVLMALRRPVFFTVLVAGGLLALARLGTPEQAMFYSRASMMSLLILIWAIAAVKISNAIIEDAMRRFADSEAGGKDFIPLVENVWKIVVYGACITALMMVWKVNITPLLASAGIMGVALALASKDTLANFFGGVSIFLDKPYRIGDYVVLDGTDRGVVIEIGIRSTRIRTRDDVLISIPNAVISNSKIVNETAPVPRYRLRISVGVSYGSDVDLVEDTLLGVARENENVLAEPAPRVRFKEFGDSSLNFDLLCWIKNPAQRGLSLHQLHKAVYKSFISAGITIPFPQRDVHIIKAKDEETP